MSRLKTASPQFLVDDLENSLTFYRECLLFETDFVYENFYASVFRDGGTIHLKCAPKLAAERQHRSAGGHLDAFFDVEGVEALHAEVEALGAPVIKPLERRPWGLTDFYVEDLDGYILCFSESVS